MNGFELRICGIRANTLSTEPQPMPEQQTSLYTELAGSRFHSLSHPSMLAWLQTVGALSSVMFARSFKDKRRCPLRRSRYQGATLKITIFKHISINLDFFEKMY